MSKPTIEALLKTGARQEKLSPLQMKSQINALKDLVYVTHEQLVANQIDRDASSNWPKEQHRFDAFFYISDINAVMSISSVGLPNDEETHGLFLYIDYRNEAGETVQLVGLQTAKVPEVVGKEEALWLSKYTPKQLQQIAELVKTANPITPRSYQSWLDEPVVPTGLEM